MLLTLLSIIYVSYAAECQPDQYWVGSECKNCNETYGERCNKCDMDVCLSCNDTDYSINPSFATNNGSCIENKQCAGKDTKGVCNKCKDGYTFDDSVKCVENPVCWKKDPESNGCLQCPDGYSSNYVNIKCGSSVKYVKCSCDYVSNCYECSDRHNCTYCKENFYVFEGKCVLCIGSSYSMVNGFCEYNYCEEKDRITGVCAKCKENYKVNANTQRCEYQGIENCEDGETEEVSDEITSFSSSSSTEESGSSNEESSSSNDGDEPVTAGNAQFGGKTASNSKCTSCYEGYVVVDGKCTQCGPKQYYNSISRKCIDQDEVENCEAYYTNTMGCEKCINGYYKNREGKCVVSTNINNCDIYKPSRDGCLYCKDGYNLYRGECYPNPHCKYEDHSCKECTDYYMIFSRTGGDYCMITDHCVDSVDNGLTCKTCEPGYYVYDGRCEQDDNCNSSTVKNNNHVCTDCKEYYKLVNDKCIHIENCTDYTDDKNDCKECDEKCKLVNGKCIDINNCAVYTDDKKHNCETCSNKYRLVDGLCTKIEHCNEYEDESEHICKICEEYYKIDNGLCVIDSSLTNCTGYIDGNCQCGEGYIPYIDTCTSKQYCVPIEEPHCLACNENKDCIKCEDGYYMTKNYGKVHCFKADNCSRLKDGWCELCKPGFSLNGSKICVESNCVNQKGYYKETPSKQCLVCKDGYYLDTTGNTCVECPKYCTKCTDANTCTDCETNYSTFTHNHHDEEQHYCEYNPHCSNRTEGGVCNHCEQGYTLVRSYCVSDAACSKTYETGHCDECKEQYSMIHHSASTSYYDGVCQFNPECKERSKLTQKCTKCNEGFSVANSDLRLCIENVNCDDVDQYGICNKCKEGYSISYEFRDYNDNSEVPFNYTICVENKHCVGYDNAGRCNKCEEGYSINDKFVCFKNEGCDEFDEEGHCTNCKAAYSFHGEHYDFTDNYNDYRANYYHTESNKDAYEIFTKCDKNDHCLNNDEQGVCKECEAGYSLVNYGFNYLKNQNVTICVQDDNCEEHNDGFCVKCKEGYYTDKGNRYECRKDEHCVESNSEYGVCKQCEKDYTVSFETGKCEYNKYCNAIEDNEEYGYCKECMNGYHLNEYNICEDSHCIKGWDSEGSNSCGECEHGYTWEDKLKLCKPNGHCKVVNGSTCVACEELYVVRKSNRMCIFEPHCNGTTEEGVCKSCEFNYRVVNDTDSQGELKRCEYVDHSHCLNTTEDGDCTVCEEGYSIAYVNDGLDPSRELDKVRDVPHDVRKRAICIENKDCVGVTKDYICHVCAEGVEYNMKTGICGGSVSTFLLLAVLLILLL